MSTILERVLQTISPYSKWVKETPTNEKKGPAASVIQQTPTPYVRVPSCQDDIKSFGRRMMTHIQSGALTQEALEKAVQEYATSASSSAKQARKTIIDEVDREIEAVSQSLPESQRQRFA